MLFLTFLKLGAQPVNIVYPLPLASFLAFSLSKSSLENFLISYLFCFFFFTAVNLWNHVNDAEDDLRGGKKDAVFLIEKGKEATIFSLSFYILSASLIPLTRDSVAIPAFIVCFALTWIYSDKFFFGKRFRRLKEDYRTEILTYALVTPSFFLLLWSFFSSFSLLAICFSVVVALIYFSAILLKDLKDLSADSLAGYRTLAVVFSPATLFKFSALIFLASLILIIALSFAEIFPKRSAITAFILLPLSYSLISIRKKNWELSLETLKELKIYTLSYPLTLAVFALLSFEF